MSSLLDTYADMGRLRTDTAAGVGGLLADTASDAFGLLSSALKTGYQGVRDEPYGLVRGLSYLPFNVIGGPVDLANAVYSPVSEVFGRRPSDKPFMGSDFLIDMYSKIRPNTTPTGSVAENVGRFTADMIDPLVAVKVGKKILAGASALDVFSDLKRWRETGERPRFRIEKDEEAGVLRVISLSPDGVGGGRAGAQSERSIRGKRKVAEGGSGTGLTEQEIDEILADDKLNDAFNIANKYTEDNFDVPYERIDPASIESNLVKQAAIGRVYEIAVQGDSQYKDLVFQSYQRLMPDVVEASGAKNYDELVEASYEAMARETKEQFNSLGGSGMTFTFHDGELEYSKASDMVRDVVQNKNLNVFRGGDEHEYLKNIDPDTGLTENEMFRAVHDMFGHSIGANSFQPKGEEIAFVSHSQMYSPLARLAMASETRGQNSFVNYGTANAELFKNIRQLDDEAKQIRKKARVSGQPVNETRLNEITDIKTSLYKDLKFAEQKSVLLPAEYISPDFNKEYFIPEYLKDLTSQPREPFYGVHYGPEGLLFADPSFQQTSKMRGEELERVGKIEGVPAPERTYFYGPESPGAEIKPESNVVEGRVRYESTGEGQALYPYDIDPLGLRTLASGRYPQPPGLLGMNEQMRLNTGESLAKLYGYTGITGKQFGGGPMSILFEPVKIKPSLF